MQGKDDLTDRNPNASVEASAIDSDHSGSETSDSAARSEPSKLSELSEPSQLYELGSEGVTRREMLKIAAGAVLAAPLVGAGLSAAAATSETAAESKAPLFFTQDEFAMVDELTELIIPSDQHSPGARAAQCAAFIDSQLAEAWDPKSKDRWRGGLGLVNQLSQEMNGKPFMQATSEQRIAVLTRIARNEKKPEKPEEHFFGELKSRTAHAYYTSKIGIHQELEYKGNTYQKEFSGFDAT
jgi:hypothetical protein